MKVVNLESFKRFSVIFNYILIIYMLLIGFSSGSALQPHNLDIQSSIENGLKYLQSTQDMESGSVGDSDRVGLTSLFLLCLIGDSSISDPIENLGMGYIFAQANESDGGIYDNYRHGCYETSFAIMALDRAENDSYSNVVYAAADYIIRCQITNITDPNFGGFRYHPYGSTADLSNTQAALLALRIAEKKGKPISNDVWRNAAEFVLRCQQQDGGFIYAPNSTRFNEGCSYGSMTAAGLMCLRICGLESANTRVNQALEWLQINYRYDINPGNGTTNEEVLNKFKYYYLWAASDALTEWRIVTDGELDIDFTVNQSSILYSGWNYDFTRYLISEQLQNGSWPGGDRYWTIINTEFALLVLEGYLLSELKSESVPFCDLRKCNEARISLNRDEYLFGDHVEYCIYIKNIGTIGTSKNRTAITYGYIDPSPRTIIMGTLMPDIVPGENFTQCGDFEVLNTFYSGEYFFFVTATDMGNPECTVTDAKRIHVNKTLIKI